MKFLLTGFCFQVLLQAGPNSEKNLRSMNRFFCRLDTAPVMQLTMSWRYRLTWALLLTGSLKVLLWQELDNSWIANSRTRQLTHELDISRTG